MADMANKKKITVQLICDGKTVVGVRMEGDTVTNTHVHKVSGMFELNENLEFCAALGFLEGVVPEEELSDTLKVRETA